MGKDAGGVVGTSTLRAARPPLHLGLYGEPHVGKSHFLAALIWAIWRETGVAGYVAFFDRRGKDLTYHKVWAAEAKKAGLTLTTRDGKDKRDTPHRDYLVGDQRLARIAQYAVAHVEETDGPSRLAEFLPVFEVEAAAGKWALFALDSLSFFGLDARKESQYVLNPTSSKGSKQHGMQWYGAESDAVEDVLCCRVPSLDCNTIIIMHESKKMVEAEGTMVRSPHVSSKRLLETNGAARTFPELWRLYFDRTDDGKKVRRVQTESDEHWQAGTIIGAPDGCRPRWDELWVGWDAKVGG